MSNAQKPEEERCAKCGCPQDEHSPVKPRRTLADRPDIESYCARCGAEDCWHFTGYAPAPPASERCCPVCEGNGVIVLGCKQHPASEPGRMGEERICPSCGEHPMTKCDYCAANSAVVMKLEAERDAARAEVANLRVSYEVARAAEIVLRANRERNR
jgi:hypothetical protein